MDLARFFGFSGDEDEYEEEEDYAEDRRRKSSGRRNGEGAPRSGSGNYAAGKLIVYNGVASENDKRRLREAFNDGAMILIDLHELSQREYEEEGKSFITFVGDDRQNVGVVD